MPPQSKQFLKLVAVSQSLRKSLSWPQLISLQRKQRPAFHPNKEQETSDSTSGQCLLSGTLGFTQCLILLPYQRGSLEQL